uniref:ATP synthase F0 subunit 8 n=1 Tax=Bangia atropurpurea TaxID=31347 RepID=UPI001FCDBEF3|nr:ATP synthase F0 subunit 8 [Bangia atropurpurea]UNJ18845.1 ATP synthase F0 subunit 8 [Bangia atropurpurea]
MPQLDRVIIFSQIFWLFLTFLVAYICYSHFVLSNLLKIFLVRWLKLRKDTTQIAIKTRLTPLLIKSNILSLRKIYFVVRTILLKTTTKLVLNRLRKDSLLTKKRIASIKELDALILRASLETSLYSSKSITKSGRYSHWT